MTTHEEDNPLLAVLLLDIVNRRLVFLEKPEVFGNNAVGHHSCLFLIFVDGTAWMNVVGAGSQYEVGFLENLLLKPVDEVIQDSLTQDIGVPQQHEFRVFGLQLGCDGVEEGVGAMQDDHVGLYLVNDLLKVAVVGKRYVLTGNLDGRGYAVNLYPVDGVHTGDTVLTETDDIGIVGLQAFCHVFRDGLDASLYRIIVFRNVE